MRPIMNWINQQKKQVLIGLMVGLLLAFSMVFSQNASAQSWLSRHNTTTPAPSPATTNSVEPSNSSATIVPVPSDITSETTEAAGAASQPATAAPTDAPADPVAIEPPNPFQEVLTKTQISFEKALAKANQAIADLPQQIEQVSTDATQAAERKKIKNELEDKQDDLENVADKIDDLAEKLASFNSKLQKSIQQAKVTVSDTFQKNAQDAQLALENTAKAINDLADDVERAKKRSTPAFRSLISEEITAVNQSLETATQTIKAFVENPT